MVDSEDFEEKLSSVPIDAEEGIVSDELLVVTTEWNIEYSWRL